MTQIHGDHLLRVKGIVRIAGESAPLVVQAVQHVVYPVRSLPAWPSGDRRSKLVFISRGLDPQILDAIPSSLRGLAS